MFPSDHNLVKTEALLGGGSAERSRRLRLVGEELPEHAQVSGETGANRDRLIEFINAQGIELEFNESIAPATGVSYGGKIVLLPRLSNAEAFSTLVHELIHLRGVGVYIG